MRKTQTEAPQLRVRKQPAISMSLPDSTRVVDAGASVSASVSAAKRTNAGAHPPTRLGRIIIIVINVCRRFCSSAHNRFSRVFTEVSVEVNKGGRVGPNVRRHQRRYRTETRRRRWRGSVSKPRWHKSSTFCSGTGAGAWLCLAKRYYIVI